MDPVTLVLVVLAALAVAALVVQTVRLRRVQSEVQPDEEVPNDPRMAMTPREKRQAIQSVETVAELQELWDLWKVRGHSPTGFLRTRVLRRLQELGHPITADEEELINKIEIARAEGIRRGKIQGRVRR